MNKKVFIVGAGGRTGTMFAEELKGACDIFGIGLDREIDAIAEKKILVSTGGREKTFEIETIRPWEFEKIVDDISPDFIFMAVKNPVGQAVKHYYRVFKNKENIPALILSQNGLSAGYDAFSALKDVLGEDAKRVQIIRLSLFNPIDARIKEGRLCVGYSRPIRLCYGVFAGNDDTGGLKDIFHNARIVAEQVAAKDVRNMEFSKLYFNLIGMASAAHGLSINDGFSDPEVFAEEIRSLKEYTVIVKAAGGRFLSFSNYPYPLEMIAGAISLLPVPALSLVRRNLAKLVSKEKNGKPKDLAEIDYYNGEVVRLAKELGRGAPVNKRILEAGKSALPVR